MRDVERIAIIQGKLTELWKYDQDQRFMQFIYNIQRTYSASNNKYGEISNEVMEKGYDMFNLEDDKFEEFLDDLIMEFLNS